MAATVSFLRLKVLCMCEEEFREELSSAFLDPSSLALSFQR
jgi:hypothetical protein